MYAHERSLVTKFEGEFQIVGVNSDSNAEKLIGVCAQKDLSWPSFFDGGSTGGPIASKWGVRGWPTLYLLDHKGVIRAKGLRGDPLEREIEKLVKEMNSAGE